MKILYFVLIVSIVIAGAWLAYRLLYVNQRSRRLLEKKFRIFEALINKLLSGEPLVNSDILPLAEDPATRYGLFEILKRFDKTALFPQVYNTLEKSAESFLVNWLEFPTELNARPEQIRLGARINVPDDPDLEYFVFEFKGDRERNEWMLGVVGPFNPDSKPYDIPRRIFSRFNVVGTVSNLTEVEWIHQHIAPGHQ